MPCISKKICFYMNDYIFQTNAELKKTKNMEQKIFLT